MKKIYLISLFTLMSCAVLNAQDQLVTYHGQFRTLLSDNRMTGNILNDDSLSTRRGAMGTLFLDLGINIKPSESFKLLAELRMRNVIGADNQQTANGVTLVTRNTLIDTRVIFRQVRAEGLIRKVVSYQIGDIDLGLTKYTLYNNNESFSDYESEIFKQRRAIAQYENFQTANLWRLQGASAKAQVNVNGPIRKIDMHLFGTRTRLNNFDGVPDRFVSGSKIEITQSKYFTLGGNWTAMFDVPGSTDPALDTLNNYNNHVFTGNYKITPFNKNKFELSIVGENGVSKNSYFLKALDSTSHKQDFFVDAGIKAVLKTLNIATTVSYINVGHNFTSPGAQTLRLRPQGTSLYFAKLNNATTLRSLNVFDRYSDEAVYNQRLHTGLMAFLPVYGNVLPYGAATPNRTGLVYNVERSIDTANVISFNAGGALLSELVSEGDSTGKNLRKFNQVQGGLVLNLSKLIGTKKLILISSGGRFEKTLRKGDAYIDFTSTLLDGGLMIEVTRGLYLLGGIKSLKGSGTEVITLRDDFGSISGYSPYVYHVQQTVASGGIRLDMFKNSFAGVEYNNLDVKNKDDHSQNYAVGNLFVNFTLKF